MSNWRLVDGQWVHTPLMGGGLAFVFDGGGAAIAAGKQIDLVVPFACRLRGWTILADQSGAIQFDVWRDTYAAFPPTDADSLTAGHEPKITASGVKAQDLDLSDWTSVHLAAGDVLRVNVDSCATITRASLLLALTRGSG